MSHGSVQKEGTMTYVQDGLTHKLKDLYAINIGGNNILIGTNANTWGEIGSGRWWRKWINKVSSKTMQLRTNITLSGEQWWYRWNNQHVHK